MTDIRSKDSNTLGWVSTDAGRLSIAGIALLVMPVAFCWNDLAVRYEYLLAASTLVLLALSVRAQTPFAMSIASGGLVLGAAAGVLWQAYAPTPALALGLIGYAAVAVIHVAFHERGAATERDDTIRRHAWVAAAGVVLAGSWAAYYQFMTLGFASESTMRRLVLTLSWLAIGLVGMALGTRKGARAISEAGVLFVATAVTKAVLYDTTHLGGPQRIALFGLAGIALLAGSMVVGKKRVA